MNKTTEVFESKNSNYSSTSVERALKLAEEALQRSKRNHYYCEDTWYSCPKSEDGCANDAEGDGCNCGADVLNEENDKALAAIREALAEQEKQEPVARPFECWSTNDGDSWFEHPADAQLIYDVLGDDPKVGDEFEVSAGWNCVTATYQIASKDGDDFEVKCVSHPNNDTAPVSAKAIRAEALEEAAKVCEKRIGGAVQNNEWWSGFKAAMKQCAAGIRGLK